MTGGAGLLPTARPAPWPALYFRKGPVMATSFGALCTDFYINQKVAVKMDLPGERETILHLFDRVRKSMPRMTRFRRYDDELALESSRRDPEYTWLALRRTSIRTGHVNPPAMADAYSFHRLLLDVAPAFLSVSPIDIDFIELLFGFDLECSGNHDEVVYEALFQDTPLAGLMKLPEGLNGDGLGRPTGDSSAGASEGASGGVSEGGGAGGAGRIIDVQPLFGLSLSEKGDMQADFEVKTRSRGRRGSTGKTRHEPISIFLTVRQYGPIDRLEDLSPVFESLAHACETLATERLVPDLLMPISRQITSSNA